MLWGIKIKRFLMRRWQQSYDSIEIINLSLEENFEKNAPKVRRFEGGKESDYMVYTRN